jgi:hypothetical protein
MDERVKSSRSGTPIGHVWDVPGIWEVVPGCTTNVKAADVVVVRKAVEGFANLTEGMWQGLMQTPPLCTPWAISWIEQEATKIDWETNVWMES